MALGSKKIETAQELSTYDVCKKKTTEHVYTKRTREGVVHPGMASSLSLFAFRMIAAAFDSGRGTCVKTPTHATYKINPATEALVY